MSVAPRALALVLAALMATLAHPGWSHAAGDAADAVRPAACGDRPLHPPIEIHEDVGAAGFVLALDPLAGEPVARPGTGVTRGAGTAADPYVIEGWCIVGPGTRVTSALWGIAVFRTEAHLVVRDNVVLAFDRGIFLYEVANVVVEENEAQDSWANVIIERSDDIVARGNHVRGGTIGLVVDGGRGALIADNVIHDTAGGAGIVLRALDSEARGNEVFGIPASASGAIKVAGGARNAVIANHLHDNGAAGILFDWTSDAVAKDNLVVRNADGIASHRAQDTVIRHNTVIENARHGITLDWWMGSQALMDNDVRLNGGSGIQGSEYLFGPSGTLRARGNNLVGNGEGGFDAVSSDLTVDARHNWWGCSEGPTDAACDRVLGARVAYDPWLTEPNAAAGART